MSLLSKLAEWIGWPRAKSSLPPFAEEVSSLVQRLNADGIRHALIGGIAVAVHGFIRGTKDIDLLIAGVDEERLHRVMAELGFETLQRGEYVSNYLLEHLRVDFVHARRERSNQMIARALPVRIGNADTRVVCLEDLIGLKLQALANKPDRYQDRLDIQRILEGDLPVDNAVIDEYAAITGTAEILNEIRSKKA